MRIHASGLQVARRVARPTDRVSMSDMVLTAAAVGLSLTRITVRDPVTPERAEPYHGHQHQEFTAASHSGGHTPTHPPRMVIIVHSLGSIVIAVAGMMESDTRPITSIPLDPAASQRSLESLMTATYVLPPQGCSARQRAITTALLAQHSLR